MDPADHHKLCPRKPEQEGLIASVIYLFGRVALLKYNLQTIKLTLFKVFDLINFDKHVQLCNHQHSQVTEHFLQPIKFHCVPLQ